MSKVDLQRAMREARWASRSRPAISGPCVPRSTVPSRDRPGGAARPADPVPAGSAADLERPAVQPGRAIGAYKQPELVSVVAWIMSDGITRTDSQILELVMVDLGFARQGRTIRSRVNEAITTVLAASES